MTIAEETFPPEGEKRGNPRIQVGLAVLIPPEDQKVMSENLSLKGCFLPQVDLGLPGNRVTIKIGLPGFGFFSVEARIAHKGQNNQGSGLEFVSLEPEAEKHLSDFLSIFPPDQ
jgi:PilZ domain